MKSLYKKNPIGGAVPLSSHVSGSVDVTRDASRGPGPVPNQANPERTSGPQAGSRSNATGKNPTSKEDPRKKNENRNRDLANNMFERGQPDFKRFFIIKSSNDGDLRKLNIFKVDREIEKMLKGEPAKIYGKGDGSLTIEVKTREQSEIIPNMKKIIDENIVVEDHRRYNESKGVIICELLTTYTEEDILDGLKDKGITDVVRMKKKVDGELVNTIALILTFNTVTLPDSLKLRPGFSVKVRPYIPLPRRCFKCQGFAHVGKYCRNETATCVNCGLDAHGETNCSRAPNCANCGGPHPASAKTCDRYKYEKELQAIKTKEKLSFREAKEYVNKLFIRPGVSFATALGASLSRKTKVKPIATKEKTPEKSPNVSMNNIDHNHNISLKSINTEYASPSRIRKRDPSSSSLDSPVLKQSEKKPKPGAYEPKKSNADAHKPESLFPVQTGLETFTRGSFTSSSHTELYKPPQKAKLRCSSSKSPTKTRESSQKPSYSGKLKQNAPQKSNKDDKAAKKRDASTSKIDTLISPSWR